MPEALLRAGELALILWEGLECRLGVLETQCRYEVLETGRQALEARIWELLKGCGEGPLGWPGGRGKQSHPRLAQVQADDALVRSTPAPLN